MENISIRFVEKIYEMSLSQFPERLIEKARTCLIDYISVAAAGSKTYDDINKKFIEQNKFAGCCRIIGSEQTADLRTAVMINAFNAHVLELDDSHRVAMTHLGAPIFSALLGVAQVYDCTLNELLRGAVIGYEAAIRLANSVQPSHKKRGFHVSGTCCTVGCALGIASMLNYSKEEMANVLSAAVTSAAGLLAVISGKSQQKPYNVANAASAGLNSALYGKYFNGAVDILNDSRGFFKAFSDEYNSDKLFEGGYAIEGIYQKLYAACRHCHAPMEAVMQIRQRENLSGLEVEDIEVKTYDLAISGHSHTDIEGVSSAKQSIPYGVAAAYLYQAGGIEMYTPEKVKDKAILALAKKVRVLEDSELTALVPAKRAAVVTVTLSDGRKYVNRVDYPKGEPENPITQNEMAQKFYDLTQRSGMTESDGKNVFNFVNGSGSESAAELFKRI